MRQEWSQLARSYSGSSHFGSRACGKDLELTAVRSSKWHSRSSGLEWLARCRQLQLTSLASRFIGAFNYDSLAVSSQGGKEVPARILETSAVVQPHLVASRPTEAPASASVSSA